MDNIKCTSDLCFGGALAIFNSNGIIEASYFTNNLCFSHGGSIGIVNLSGNITITLTHITHSTSLKGNGGGLAFISNVNNYMITTSDSIIENNSAIFGGGIYLDFQLNPIIFPYLALIFSTSIQHNKATTLGGGIFY